MKLSERPITLKKSQHSIDKLFLPKNYIDQLKQLNPFPNQLSFGSKITDIEIAAHDDPFTCELSANIWKTLSLPFEANVHLYAKDEVLHIGPLIGIFTAGFTSSKQRPVADRSLMFAQYLTAAEKMGGYFFLFGSHVIDWDNGTISGYFYTKTGWEQFDVPFPHVVYNRIPNRKAEQLPILQKIKENMQNHYFIPWFNSGFFNKWTIYEKLRQDERVNHCLPETVINPSLEKIEAMLHEYKHIYVKPANGSLGIGIHHIIRREKDGMFYCRFKDQNENKIIIKRYPTIKQLVDAHFLPSERYNLVVQQGVSLLKINNRSLDFRIHTNKNIHGQWKISAMAAKISAYNQLTTHIANGGSVKSIDELIQENRLFEPYIEKLKQITLLLSQSLEEKLEGFHGEFGFDMGVDKNGNIWMFEVNSKPGRAIFIHPKLKKADLETRKLPFEFGTYLTETIISKPETVLT